MAQLSTYQQLASPLPLLPDGELFTEDQWKTLLALTDTFIPSLTDIENRESFLTQLILPKDEYAKAQSTLVGAIPKDISFDSDNEYPSREELVRKYLEESASDVAGLKESLHRTIACYVPEDGRKGIAFILSALK